jgi:hypothetical protein
MSSGTEKKQNKTKRPPALYVDASASMARAPVKANYPRLLLFPWAAQSTRVRSIGLYTFRATAAEDK